MTGVGMTYALRALSRFRAASSADIKELIRLLRGTANPYVAGVCLTTLATNVALTSYANGRHSTAEGLKPDSHSQSTVGAGFGELFLGELAATLLQVVEAFPGRAYREWGQRSAPEWPDVQVVSTYVPRSAHEEMGAFWSMDEMW